MSDEGPCERCRSMTYGRICGSCLSNDNAKLRAEVLDLRRVLGPYSTVEIALKAQQGVLLQVGDFREALESIVRVSKTPSTVGLAQLALDGKWSEKRKDER